MAAAAAEEEGKSQSGAGRCAAAAAAAPPLSGVRQGCAHRRELREPEEERGVEMQVAVAGAQGGQGERGQVVHEHVAAWAAQLWHVQGEEHLRNRGGDAVALAERCRRRQCSPRRFERPSCHERSVRLPRSSR